MFTPNDMRQLSGLSLEKQVIEILLEQDEPAPMLRSAIQSQLVPKPTNDAMNALLERMLKRKEIAEFPSGDEIHAPLIGLPGWALKQSTPDKTSAPFKPFKPELAPSAIAAAIVAKRSTPPQPTSHQAPVAPTPSLETTTMKTRISAETANAAVAAVLTVGKRSLKEIAKDAKLAVPAAKSALVRLRKLGRAAVDGAGRSVGWKIAAAAPENSTTVSVSPTPVTRTRPTRGNGIAKFGFFSDGSLSIDSEECTGTLAQSDLKSLLEFAGDHVK